MSRVQLERGVIPQISRNERATMWETTAGAGDTFSPTFTFPSTYAGSAYLELSDGTIEMLTSAVAVSHVFPNDGPHHMRIKGVPYNSITKIDFGGDKMVGDVGDIIYPLDMTYISLAANSGLTGDFTTMNLPAGLNTFSIHSCAALTGDVGTFSFPESLTHFYVRNISGVTCSKEFTFPVCIVNIWIQSCVLTETEVGYIISSIWTDRAKFTYASPTINISGTNAVPAGTVAAPPGETPYETTTDWEWDSEHSKHIPLTAGAKIYDLENDVNTESFNTWGITYTAPA